MAVLSGWLVVLRVTHWEGKESSSSISVDLNRLGLAGGQLVIREREAGGCGLQPREDQDQESSRASAR